MADFLVFSEFVWRFPFFVENHVAFKIVVPIVTAIYFGIDVYTTVPVSEILDDFEVSAKDPFRLDTEAEECVKIIKEELNKTIEIGKRTPIAADPLGESTRFLFAFFFHLHIYTKVFFVCIY